MIYLIDDAVNQLYISFPVYFVVFFVVDVEKNGFEIVFRSCLPSINVLRN